MLWLSELQWCVKGSEEQVVEVADVGIELLRNTGFVDAELITYIHAMVRGLGDETAVEALVCRDDDRALRFSGEGVTLRQCEADDHLFCGGTGILHGRQTCHLWERLFLQRRIGKGRDGYLAVADGTLIADLMFLLYLWCKVVEPLLLTITLGSQSFVQGGLGATDLAVGCQRSLDGGDGFRLLQLLQVHPLALFPFL